MLPNRNSKILIVGHSRGLGEFLYREFTNLGYHVEGVSRSSGFDIKDPSIRKKLLEKSLEFDVVILCARAGFAQVDFLCELHSWWKSQSFHKQIITIGSKASVDYLTRPDQILTYDYEKLSLEKLAETLSLFRSIRLSHINLDYMQTESIMSKKELKDQPKLPLKDVAKFIDWIIQSPDHFCVAKTNLWAR